MPLSLDPKGGAALETWPVVSGLLRLPRRLDSQSTETLIRTLLAHRGAAITLSGEEVEMLGAQAAAVLVSAVRTWSADGQDFHLADRSEALLRDLRLLGLQSEEVIPS